MAENTPIRDLISAPQFAMSFLQEMIKQGRLKAYHINSHGRNISLFPVEILDERTSFVIEDTKSMARYVFDMHSWGGLCYNDGDGQTIYSSLYLRRLPENFKTNRLGKKDYYGRVLLEDECVEAELRLNHEDDWESAGDIDCIAGTRSTQKAEKGQDNLFDELLAYIRR